MNKKVFCFVFYKPIIKPKGTSLCYLTSDGNNKNIAPAKKFCTRISKHITNISIQMNLMFFKVDVFFNRLWLKGKKVPFAYHKHRIISRQQKFSKCFSILVLWAASDIASISQSHIHIHVWIDIFLLVSCLVHLIMMHPVNSMRDPVCFIIPPGTNFLTVQQCHVGVLYTMRIKRGLGARSPSVSHHSLISYQAWKQEMLKSENVCWSPELDWVIPW